MAGICALNVFSLDMGSQVQRGISAVILSVIAGLVGSMFRGIVPSLHSVEDRQGAEDLAPNLLGILFATVLMCLVSVNAWIFDR